jgi:hypothetical protein
MRRAKQGWKIISDITTIQQVLQWFGAWRLVGAVMSSVIAGVGSWFSHLAWPIIFVIGLAAFGSAIWGANAVIWMRERHIPTLKPKRSVFPYIRTVNASSLIDAGEEYLTMSVFFPSQLDRLRLSVEGEVVIDGHTSNQLPAKDITLSSEGVSTISDWRVPLTKAMVKDVQEHHKAGLPVTISASIWDRNRKDRYRWETERWTTLLLTKLN